MIFLLLADLVLILHLAFIGFALLGGLLGLWKKWVLLVQLPAAVWAAVVELAGWICPLTPLENILLSAGGAAGFSDGFLPHYLIRVIYPPGLTRELQWLLGGIAVLLNAAVYWYVIRHRRIFR